MNNSTEDTKNLDSYGVWIKRPPQDAASDDFNIDADIPDFSKTDDSLSAETSLTDTDSAEQDFSFPDISEMSDGEDLLHNDTALTTEELSNITESIDENEPQAAEESVLENDMPSISDGDTEISLDDFLDEGLTDPNPPAETETDQMEEISDSAEEISLDDFLDESSFSDESAKKDDLEDEEPLDIDLSFTETDSETVPLEIEGEANNTDSTGSDSFNPDAAEDITADSFEDMFDTIEDESAVKAENEEQTITLEDPANDIFTADSTENIPAKESGDTEEVDLSDFGIDKDAEETPINSDIEQSKNKNSVVDYDLSVSQEDKIATAPVINEIKTDEKSTGDAASAAENTTVNNQLLEQIVSELSGLKNEINKLKNEFTELKSRETITAVQPDVQTEADVSAEPSAETEINITDPSAGSADTGGFFNADDSDETIALSGDELDNIMNTVDFSSETEKTADETEPVSDEPETSADEEQTEEEPDVIEEDQLTAGDETEPVMEVTAPDFSELDAENEFSETEENTLPEEGIIDAAEDTDTQISDNDTADFTNETPFGAIDDPSVVEIPDIESDSGLKMDFDNENLEEPDLETFAENAESPEFSEIPEEISIPKVDEVASENAEIDDIIVDSSPTDFMDSVKNSDEAAAEPYDAAEPLEAESAEEPVEAMPEAEDITISDENEEVLEDEAVTDAVTEEEQPAPIEETKIINDFLEEDPDLTESISDKNIDYLKEDEVPAVQDEEETQEETEPAEADSETLPSDIKSEVKSVLLYMDQLLENLPEEKIMEFAKSEQFVTYKKLFSELGLS